jgi:hypothetical protein
VLAVAGAITAIMLVKKARTTNLLVLLSMVLIFFAYYELYQHMLSSLLFLQIERSLIGVPTGWPKPIWWWVLYVAPKAFLFSLLGVWVVPFLVKKRIPKSDEIFGMVAAGEFLILLGFLIPNGFPPLRVLNQFGGHFSNGVASLKRSNIFMIALAAILLMGLVTEFPMTNMSNFYVGGYWPSHSSQEISAIQYLAANATSNSRIAIDGRCRNVLAGLAAPQKKLTPITNWEVFDVYNTTSTEQAWTVCTHNNYTYVFVSEFYKIIAHFDVYGAAEKFSENQLSKFSSPYFSLWYKNSEVAVYLVVGKV